MEYSEQVLNSSCPAFSECCRLVAHGSGTFAVLRDADALGVLSEYDCPGAVAQARLSPDGQYLLCVLKKGAAAYVFDVNPDSDWSCIISEGAGGLAYARWIPTSRHILTCVGAPSAFALGLPSPVSRSALAQCRRPRLAHYVLVTGGRVEYTAGREPEIH